MLTIQIQTVEHTQMPRVTEGPGYSLPALLIDERDEFLNKLCAVAQQCQKSDQAVSNLVQECSNLVGFGAVLSALTIYANLHEAA